MSIFAHICPHHLGKSVLFIAEEELISLAPLVFLLKCVNTETPRGRTMSLVSMRMGIQQMLVDERMNEQIDLSFPTGS